MSWFNQLQRNIGQAYQPNYGSLQPLEQNASNMMGITQLGAGLLANANQRLPVAMGRSMQQLPQQGMLALSSQAAMESMNDARMKRGNEKDERERKRRAMNDILKSGNQEAVMRLQLGDINGALTVLYPQSAAGMGEPHGMPLQTYDPNTGQYGYTQLTKSGNKRVIAPPEGQQWAGPFEKNMLGGWGKKAGEASSNLPGAIVQAEDTVRQIDSLLMDKNLGKITGVESYAPKIFGYDTAPLLVGKEATALKAKVRQLRGKAFMQAYETLKGGGQITQIEGDKATEALARLDTAQTDEEFRQALVDFKDAIRVGLQKLRAGAESRPGMTNPAPAPSQGGGGNDPMGIRQ